MTTTIDEFRLSPVIELANAVSRPFERVINLTPDALRAAAEKQTGLSDWGSDDFWPGFEALFNATDADNSLTLVGRISMRVEGLHRLKNRLLLEQALKREPEILNNPVRRPLFIIGFPRTGTTLLHKLLTQDPDVHVPLHWRLYSPLPQNVSQAEIDRRVKESESLMRFADFIAPQWKVIHPTGAHEPEECVFLLTDNLTYAVRTNIPDYVNFYLHEDLNPGLPEFQAAFAGASVAAAGSLVGAEVTAASVVAERAADGVPGRADRADPPRSAKSLCLVVQPCGGARQNGAQERRSGSHRAVLAAAVEDRF